jgi:hypothetical protein
MSGVEPEQPLVELDDGDVADDKDDKDDKDDGNEDAATAEEPLDLGAEDVASLLDLDTGVDVVMVYTEFMVFKLPSDMVRVLWLVPTVTTGVNCPTWLPSVFATEAAEDDDLAPANLAARPPPTPPRIATIHITKPQKAVLLIWKCVLLFVTLVEAGGRLAGTVLLPSGSSAVV